MVRQEILEYFETTQYDQLARGGQSGRTKRFQSQRGVVPMSMRAGGPKNYPNMLDEEDTKSYGQARQDF